MTSWRWMRRISPSPSSRWSLWVPSRSTFHSIERKHEEACLSLIERKHKCLSLIVEHPGWRDHSIFGSSGFHVGGHPGNCRLDFSFNKFPGNCRSTILSLSKFTDFQMTSWSDATLGGLAFGVGMTTYSHKVICFGCWYYILIFYSLFCLQKNMVDPPYLEENHWSWQSWFDITFLLAAFWSVKPGGAVPGDCGGVWSCVGGWLRGQSVQVRLLSISKHPNWIFLNYNFIKGREQWPVPLSPLVPRQSRFSCRPHSQNHPNQALYSYEVSHNDDRPPTKPKFINGLNATKKAYPAPQGTSQFRGRNSIAT